MKRNIATNETVARWYIDTMMRSWGVTIDEAVDKVIDSYPGLGIGVIMQVGNELKKQLANGDSIGQGPETGL